jgi:ABC-2 type transport system ATP-binding protein
MEQIIQIKGLTKKYGDLAAVDNFTLDIEKGELVGLLGHNGAGKTTMLVMMAGLTMPTEGTILIDGKDIQKEPISVKENISFMPDNTQYYGNMTAKENLEYFSDLADTDRSRIPELLEIVGMKKWADKKVNEFSKGMIQRLGVAQTLVRNPKIIILDEPTSGIDPEGIIELNRMFRELNEKGITLIVSSHVLSEVKKICTKIAIMKKGKLIAYDTFKNLARKFPLKEKCIILETNDQSRTGELLDSIEDASYTAKEGVFKIKSHQDIKSKINHQLTKQGIDIITLMDEELSLEELFIKYYEVD